MASRGRKRVDLTGRTFGRWTVLQYVGRCAGRKPVWKCRCACGVIQDVRLATLKGAKQACNRCARLAKSMYQEVARMRKAGLPQTEIARQIGRTHQQVSKIVQFLAERP